MQEKISSFIRFPVFFSLFIIIGLSFGYLTFKVLSFSRTVEVPSLISSSLIEANEILNNAGLYLKIDGEDYDALVPSGRILRQDIPAGNKVKEKRAIKVIVSKGPRAYSIPPVVNETLGNAESLLLQQGLKIGKTINVHSDHVEKGRIVSQNPEPDERLTDYVTVLVSTGRHELSYYCPDFLNRHVDYAQGVSDKLGLILETRGTGNIIKSQDPEPGSIVKTGDKLILVMKEETTHD